MTAGHAVHPGICSIHEVWRWWGPTCLTLRIQGGGLTYVISAEGLTYQTFSLTTHGVPTFHRKIHSL